MTALATYLQKEYSFDKGSDEQGAEKTLRHGTEGVNQIAFDGDLDVFSFQKCFNFFHFSFPDSCAMGNSMFWAVLFSAAILLRSFVKMTATIYVS